MFSSRSPYLPVWADIWPAGPTALSVSQLSSAPLFREHPERRRNPRAFVFRPTDRLPGYPALPLSPFQVTERNASRFKRLCLNQFQLQFLGQADLLHQASSFSGRDWSHHKTVFIYQAQLDQFGSKTYAADQNAFAWFLLLFRREDSSGGFAFFCLRRRLTIGRKQFFAGSQMSGRIHSLLSTSTASLRLRAKKEPLVHTFCVRRRAGPRLAGGR
jgi:hypothetical protein